MKKLRAVFSLVMVLALVCVMSASAYAMPFEGEKWVRAVHTGDEMNVVLWIVIVAVSALLIAAGVFFLIRAKKKK